MSSSKVLSPIGFVVEALGAALPSSTDSRGTLGAITKQLGILDAHVDRLRLLQAERYSTDPWSVAKSFQDTIETANRVARSVQDYHQSSTARDSKAGGLANNAEAPQSPAPRSISQEEDLRHLMIDVEQCTTLVEFAISIRLRPDNSEDIRCATELHRAAEGLESVRKINQQEARIQIITRLIESANDPSTEYSLRKSSRYLARIKVPWKTNQ
jgi:hypothetical protein